MKKFTPQIQKALNLAGELHDGQERKGDGLPYIVHPVAVAWIISEYSEDEDVITAAILHDTVEDCEYSKEQLENDFGPRVAEMVMSVTETNKEDPWQKRKDDYLAHLEKASYEAQLICAADKLHNLQSMIAAIEKYSQEEAIKKFNAPLDKKIWFYKKCTETISKNPKIPKELIDKINKSLETLESDSDWKPPTPTPEQKKAMDEIAEALTASLNKAARKKS